MKLIKICNKKKTCQTKDGKSYHPTYYVLDLNRMDDGLSTRILVNFPNLKTDRKLLDSVATFEIKE